MKGPNFYLQRYGFPKSLFASTPRPDLGIVVVIPCFNEPELIKSLGSLMACNDTRSAVEILVIINDSDQSSQETQKQNQSTYKDAQLWLKNNLEDKRQILIHYESQLPYKQSGVGMARKIGMDEAIRRLEKANKGNGIIVSFDADSTCDPNYLSAIEKHFLENPKSIGASIYFEHPFEGALSAEHYRGIVFYELFLRYYINALRYAGFPYAYQTIGSSMAVRSAIYQKQGGMNKRKAGEDFYFLHKIIPLGDFGEINNTCVIPSARASDRVPFGTGKAIKDWLGGEDKCRFTYHPDIFTDLKIFLDEVDQLFRAQPSDLESYRQKWPESIGAFLSENNFSTHLNEINRYCGPTREAFLKRFYAWFNGFKVLKFVHFARDNFHQNIEIEQAVQWLLSQVPGMKAPPPQSAKQQLLTLRKLDRKG